MKKLKNLFRKGIDLSKHYINCSNSDCNRSYNDGRKICDYCGFDVG